MKKIKTTFTALVALLAIFATAFTMLVFPARGNAAATASDPNRVHVSDLFSFTDGQTSTKTFIGQADADSLPNYAKNGSLEQRSGGKTYTDFTNKGAYISLTKSEDKGGTPANGAITAGVTNVNNVVRTKTFSLADNTKDDVLFSYIPLPQTGSRYQLSSENGTREAKDLLGMKDDSVLPTARHFYVKIVDASNPNTWIRFGYEYRLAIDASYDFANLFLNGRKNNGPVTSLKLNRGDAIERDNALVPDTAWLKYNVMNRLYYDATEKAIYADLVTTKIDDTPTKGSVRRLSESYTDKMTFDFDQVYLEFCYVGGGGDTTYLIGDLDGVSLATDADGYLDGEAVATYNNREETYYTDIPVGEFGSVKEYSLPALVRANMFTEKGNATNETKNYYVTVTEDGKDCSELLSGLNDGRWTENTTFTPVREGDYVIKYTKGTAVYALKARITKDKTVDETFTVDDSITVLYDKLAPSYMASGGCAGTGLGFTWSTGGTIAINKEFDARLFTLDRAIIEFAVTPKVKSTFNGDNTASSEYEFDNLIVKLTDAEDENIFVNFYVNASRFANNLAFGTVAASGQTYANDKKNNNMGFGTFASNNGVTISSAWSGTTTNTTKLYYDSTTQETALAPSTYKNTIELGGGRFMMRDLDLEEHLLGNDVAFGGFTSGKIKLSITVSDALRDDASMIVYSFMGQKLGSSTVADVTAPEITDVGDFLTVDPNAQIGVSFPLPEATAFDVMSGDRTAQMWYKLVDPDGNDVTSSIKDGSFKPTQIGEYKYTVYANDESLNVSSLTFPITVVKKLPSIYLTLKDVNGKAFEYSSEAKIGESVKTPVYTVTGGSGNKSVEYTVIDPDGNEVDLSTSTIEYSKQGLYTARYVVTDYLGSPKTYEYFTRVAYSDTPVISDVNIPKAILAGKTVTFPKPVAYDYYSFIGERREADVEVTVTEQGKDPVKLGSDLKFTPTIESGTVKIEYRAKAVIDSNQVSEPREYTTTVIKPTTTGEYFVRDGVELSYDRVDTVNLEAVYSATQPGSSMTFVNPLNAIGFTIQLYSLSGSDMSKAKIVLTDSVNRDQRVEISVATAGTMSLVSINGGTAKTANGSLGEGKFFKLSLKSGYRLMDSSNNSLGVITDTIYGEAFNGFTSGKIYVDIVVDEVGANGARFAVRNLMNQARFLKTNEDNFPPAISLDCEYTLYNTFGSALVLSKASVADVLDPNATISLTVNDPDGNVILNKASADVNRTLTLEKYGTYVLTYEAIDSAGKKNSQTYNIISYDNVKPVIEIKGTVKTSYRVGDKLKVNEVRATDNVSAPEDMTVYVMVTEHYTNKVETYVVSEYGTKDSSTDTTNVFTFKKAGTYTLRFYVRDAAYNFAQATFTVTVTE